MHFSCFSDDITTLYWEGCCSFLVGYRLDTHLTFFLLGNGGFGMWPDSDVCFPSCVIVGVDSKAKYFSLTENSFFPRKGIYMRRLFQ